MDKKKKSKLRTAVQIAFTAVSNGYAYGFVNGKIFKGFSKSICFPGLNCYSCPGALGACPIGALQAVLGDRKYKFSFYIFGFLIFTGSVFGRFVCGWLCPFGFVQDLIYKIPFFKKLKRLPGEKFLRYFKYIILVLFVILLPLTVLDIIGQGSPWFCKYICPSGTLLAGLPLIILNPELRDSLGILFYLKVAVLVFLILLSLAVYRPFCRYLCPLGAVYGLFNPVSLIGYKIDSSKCTKCGKCISVCKMDIDVVEKINGTECIRCGECRNACPTGAIVFKNGKAELKSDSVSDIGK